MASGIYRHPRDPILTKRENKKMNDMQGYDAIVAVSQNNINANFKFLFGKDNGIRKRINLQIESEEATLVGEIRAPQVRLRLDESPRKVLFIIDIKTGVLTYYTGRGPRAKQQTMPISNWKIALVVNLRLDDLDQRLVPIPSEVKAKLKNLAAGAFSIRQLFMDLQTADIATWDPRESTIPDSLKTDGEALPIVQLMINKYLAQLRQNGHHILGYAVTVENPNLAYNWAPTIAPTDLNFYVNSYKPQNGNANDAGLDTLCYLLMTGNREMPSATPSWFGNWVQNTQEFGKASINKTNFFDQFLLPHLAKTTNICTKIDRYENSWNVRIASTVGGKEYKPTPDGGYYEDPHVKKFGNENTDNEWSAIHSSKVSAAAGGNTIEIKGSSEMFYYTERWIGIKYHALSSMVKLGTHLDWSTVVTLRSVQRGELEVDVAQLKVEERVLDEDNFGARIDKTFVAGLEEQCKTMVREVTAIVQHAVDPSTLQERITEQLRGLNTFVFPGGGDFKMTNPRFNEHRDLIVDLMWETG
jgi:hypothetical protein